MTRPRVLAAAAALLLGACTVQRWQPMSRAGDDHAAHVAIELPRASTGVGRPSGGASWQGLPGVPAANADAAARLAASPRKGQFARVAYEPGSKDSLTVWISFPQTTEKRPVVVVIHDNQGLSTWVRGVADQLATDGFVAVAPDLLSRARGGASEVELPGDSVRRIISGVARPDRQLGTLATANYVMSLPQAEKRYGVVGYCWGGGESFFHAVHSPTLGAAVVFYGSPPPADSLGKIRAPVLGLYGGTDNRINATISPTDGAMKAAGKSYETHIFDGADHGFLRSQSTPANVEAAKQAWPMAVAFFRKNLAAK